MEQSSRITRASLPLLTPSLDAHPSFRIGRRRAGIGPGRTSLLLAGYCRRHRLRFHAGIGNLSAELRDVVKTAAILTTTFLPEHPIVAPPSCTAASFICQVNRAYPTTLCFKSMFMISLVISKCPPQLLSLMPGLVSPRLSGKWLSTSSRSHCKGAIMEALFRGGEVLQGPAIRARGLLVLLVARAGSCWILTASKH